MEVKKKNEKSVEVQKILEWCKRNEVRCEWVVKGIANDKVLLRMYRGYTFAESKQLNEKDIPKITFETYKKILSSLLNKIKEKDEEQNENIKK